MIKGAAVATAAISGLAGLVTVSRQEYLSMWEHELVDIERIIDEWESCGPEQCALLLRYTPATGYYLLQRGLPYPPSPDAAESRRLVIATGTLCRLDDLWNESVSGFEEYSSPQVRRRLSRSSVYVADRIGADAEAVPGDEVSCWDADGGESPEFRVGSTGGRALKGS